MMLDDAGISEIIRDAEELLGDIIAATEKTDKKACLHKENWQKRHRLHVLLEAAKTSQKTLPRNVVVAPWFIVELKDTIDLIKRWKNRPGWNEIEPSLVDSDSFAHTILQLYLAEYLESFGQKVELVPRNDKASPDLMLYVVDDERTVFIECYRPSKLNGSTRTITEEEAYQIVKKAIKKTMRQIGESYGIAAIGGYNLSKKSINNIERSVTNYLRKRHYHNLMGVSLLTTGILYEINKEGESFSYVYRVDYIDNPNYFGSISVESKEPINPHQFVSNTLKDIKSEWICELGNSLCKVMLLHPSDEADSENKSETPREDIIYKKLPIIDPPKSKERTIINGLTNPSFKGNGNISYLCGHCEALLAENIWELSLINIVIKCPKCNAYNFIPDLNHRGYKKIALAYNLAKKIAIAYGEYNLSQMVLRNGLCLIGCYISPKYMKSIEQNN